MVLSRAYVRVDDQGVFRIGETRVSLDSVVHAYLQGHSAESIAEQYPALTLVEVYGAIAFYLENREDVDKYLRKQEQLWDRLRAQAEANPSPMIERLRAIKRARGVS
jgi:uncharacterized protein (DUF433 family)